MEAGEKRMGRMNPVLKWVTYAALLVGAALLLFIALSVPMPMRAGVLVFLVTTLPGDFVIVLLLRER
jgi:hypothetical protein